jgi:Mg2+-importing ATPase
MLTLTVAIPFMPYGGLLGFEPLPPILIATLGAIAALYVAAAELTKRWFYRHVSG